MPIYDPYPKYIDFTEYTPVVPELYWNVYSSEERIKALCMEWVKLTAYVDGISDTINNQYKIITDMQEKLPELIDENVIIELRNLINSGEFDEYLHAIATEYWNEYESRIVSLENKTKILDSFTSGHGMVIAHKGASLSAPSNTIAAFSLAGKYGFKYCETDIRKTQDGVYVCLHDANLQGLEVAETNYADLKNLAITSGANVDVFPNEHVTRLEEYLFICGFYGMAPVIEFKGGSNFTNADVIEICNIVKKYQLDNKTQYISFTGGFCVAAKQHVPYATVLLVSSSLSDSAAIFVNNNNLDGFCIDVNNLTHANVNYAKSIGKLVTAYNCDANNACINAFNMGVDGVTVGDGVSLTRCTATNKISAMTPRVKNLTNLAFPIPVGNEHLATCGNAKHGVPYNHSGLVLENNMLQVYNFGTRITIPVFEARVGDIIKFNTKNGKYRFGIAVYSTNKDSDYYFKGTARDDGWITTDIGYIVTPVENGDKTVYLAITMAGGSNTNLILSEFACDEMAECVTFLGASGWKFQAFTSANRIDDRTNNINRTLSPIIPVRTGTTFNCPANTFAGAGYVAIQFNTSSGQRLGDSGWVTTSDVTMTLNENANSIVINGRNNSGAKITGVQAYSIYNLFEDILL